MFSAKVGADGVSQFDALNAHLELKRYAEYGIASGSTYIR
jgi:hypothetical protein